jgi:hypothetical protein
VSMDEWERSERKSVYDDEVGRVRNRAVQFMRLNRGMGLPFHRLINLGWGGLGYQWARVFF